jgi:hypothetical protein
MTGMPIASVAAPRLVIFKKSRRLGDSPQHPFVQLHLVWRSVDIRGLLLGSEENGNGFKGGKADLGCGRSHRHQPIAASVLVSGSK